MARNAEGSHGTHATLAHATRSEILTYLKGKGLRPHRPDHRGPLGIPDSTLSGHFTVMKPRDCSSRANPSIVEDLILSLQVQ